MLSDERGGNTALFEDKLERWEKIPNELLQNRQLSECLWISSFGRIASSPLNQLEKPQYLLDLVPEQNGFSKNESFVYFYKIKGVKKKSTVSIKKLLEEVFRGIETTESYQVRFGLEAKYAKSDNKPTSYRFYTYNLSTGKITYYKDSKSLNAIGMSDQIIDRLLAFQIPDFKNLKLYRVH